MFRGGATRRSPKWHALDPLGLTCMLLPNTSRKRVSWDFRCVAKAVCPRSLRGSVRCQSAEARARPAQPLCMLQLNIGCNTVGQDSVGWRQESEPTQHHVSVACDPGTRPKNLKNGVRLMHSRLNANKPAHGDFMRRCQHKLVDWPLIFVPCANPQRRGFEPSRIDTFCPKASPSRRLAKA